MDDRLKKIIFRKLYEDLSHVEIIPHDDSVWFIDRDKEYWYLEYCNGGVLYWRHSFFVNFFELFSMESEEFELFIGEWVEQVLNRKEVPLTRLHQVGELIECNIYTPTMFENGGVNVMKTVLNYKVDRMLPGDYMSDGEADQVLNYEKHK